MAQRKNNKPKKAFVSKSELLFKQLEKQYRQSYNSREYGKALEKALEMHRLDPKNLYSLENAAICCIYLEKWEDAINFSKKVLTAPKVTIKVQINALDNLSHAYGALGKSEEASKYGTEALLKRDSLFANTASLNPDSAWYNEKIKQAKQSSGKKIISFSLFGNNPMYIEPAVLNAELNNKIYPDWKCRFYVDESVPKQAIERLKKHNAEIIYANEKQKLLPPTTWRFLALDDPLVSRVIFRDADSVISPREAYAVNEWEKGDYAFHIIRDAGSHTELLLAGLWGAVSGVVTNVEEKIYDYVLKEGDKLSARFADQYFLREQIWPIARNSILTHSNIFNFMETKALPEIKGATDNIGRNEAISKAHIDGEYPNDEQYLLTLYTKLSSYIDLDGKQEVLEDKRLICSYTVKPVNNKISVNIPRRFVYGLKNGTSSFSLKKMPKLKIVLTATTNKK